MKGILVNDWTKFDHTNPEDQKALMRALRFRIALQEPFPVREFAKHKKFNEVYGKVRAAMRAFTTTGDFPVGTIDLIEKYRIQTHYDNGFEMIFDIRDFSGSKVPGFRLMDVQSGLTFEHIPIGKKITLKQMSGSQEFVLFDYYGGGLNWHNSLFENQEYWAIEDTALEFVNKAAFTRASVHYQLIEAAMNSKACISLTDPACGDCSEYSVAIANAINTAITTILYAVQNKGYGVSPGTTFIVLCPLELMGAVKRALDVRLQAFSDSEKQVDFNVQPVFSMMLTNRNRLGVILPKFKIKSGTKLNLKTFESFDMLSYSSNAAGWLAFGAAIGDLDQIECIDATRPSGVGG